MNKKILLGIGSILILVLIVYFTSLNKSAPLVDETNNIPYVPQPEQIGTEMPTTEKETVAQPAYLVDAYSKGPLNYIEVDYVEWLHDEASLKAQVEDGHCISVKTQDCYDFPNGYKRNRNPQIRILEVSPLVSIEVGAIIESEINQTMGTAIPISFYQLKDVVSKMRFYYNENASFPFKPAKTFITIDIKDNLVTKIVEPYQE